jgi:hypothetical protein
MLKCPLGWGPLQMPGTLPSYAQTSYIYSPCLTSCPAISWASADFQNGRVPKPSVQAVHRQVHFHAGNKASAIRHAASSLQPGDIGLVQSWLAGFGLCAISRGWFSRLLARGHRALLVPWTAAKSLSCYSMLWPARQPKCLICGPPECQ